MKRMPTLEFAQRPQARWLGWSVAGAAAAVAVAVAWSGWTLEARNRAVAATVAARTATAPAPRKLTQAERLRLAQAQAVAGELGTQWSVLLGAIEEHGSADVGLLKLEPDARSGVVRLTGETRSTATLFAYLKSLEADPRLSDVLLTGYQLEKDAPGQPVRFTMRAGWRLVKETT